MKKRDRSATLLLLAALCALVALTRCAGNASEKEEDRVAMADALSAQDDHSPRSLAEGQQVFRFDSFEDETFWSDQAKMQEVVRDTVSPAMALKVGLKVDADAIPADLAAAIKAGKVDLGSPATTVALLKLNAVVGLKGTVDTVDGKDKLSRLGITCALCHSTVDDSFSPGIGHRMDGWPNHDLDIGAIIALSPALSPAQKAVYGTWGPGKYDPRYNLDGKSNPLVLPPAYGLAEVKNETYTAEGPISYWNAYVAVTQMHGLGNFSDSRLGIDVKNSPDLVGPKLASLRAYQHSLPAPRPRAGSFDSARAARGRAVFQQSCERCHVNVTGTDNNAGVLHAPSETGMDGAYAARTTAKAYRTTPLRGLWQHPPYFHDGSAKTLEAVVAHYNRVQSLALTEEKRADLVEFLKSL